MSIIDVWLSFDFKPIIDLPIFIMSRYGRGDNGLALGKTDFYGGGLGYKFEKYLRVIAWYDVLDNEAEDKAKNSNPEKTFYIKGEVHHIHQGFSS